MTHSRKWSWLKAWGMKIARHRGMKRVIVAVASKQPSRQPCLQCVGGIAGCRLLCLRQNKLPVPRQGSVESVAF
jgi:hypothetical protein